MAQSKAEDKRNGKCAGRSSAAAVTVAAVAACLALVAAAALLAAPAHVLLSPDYEVGVLYKGADQGFAALVCAEAAKDIASSARRLVPKPPGIRFRNATFGGSAVAKEAFDELYHGQGLRTFILASALSGKELRYNVVIFWKLNLCCICPLSHRHLCRHAASMPDPVLIVSTFPFPVNFSSGGGVCVSSDFADSSYADAFLRLMDEAGSTLGAQQPDRSASGWKRKVQYVVPVVARDEDEQAFFSVFRKRAKR